MNFTKCMESLSEEIGGRFTEYDSSNSIIIVPLGDNRYQTVLGSVSFSEELMSDIIKFSSKICAYHDGINLKVLLSESKELFYSRFAVIDGFVKVEAATYLDEIQSKNKALLKSMIMEIAQKADNWEKKLTGLDVY